MRHLRIERFVDPGLDTPTLESLRLLAHALTRSAMAVPVEVFGTGRPDTAEPQWQPLFTESTPPASLFNADYSDLETRVTAMHPGFAAPYGRRPGAYRLSGSLTELYTVRTASGNARQRRRQVRIWRQLGYTVQPHH